MSVTGPSARKTQSSIYSVVVSYLKKYLSSPEPPEITSSVVPGLHLIDLTWPF